jgi:hypothetical protein
MRISLIILIVATFFCLSLKVERDNHIEKSLTILQIRNEHLLPILDSIISHEKHCDYYTPKLYFSIRSQTINDTIIEFQIGALGSMLVELGDSHYKGYFKHNGHCFFVEGQELNETVFIKSNQRKAFVFYKSEEITSDGKILLRVFEDDTYSFWIYHYIDGDFIFKEMYNFHCKK